MSACGDRWHLSKAASWWQRCREVAAWALPGVVLTLMPKCPACLAAYIAVCTGLGLSFTTASYLRAALLVLCVASLLCLVVTRLGRFLGFARITGSVPSEACLREASQRRISMSTHQVASQGKWIEARHALLA